MIDFGSTVVGNDDDDDEEEDGGYMEDDDDADADAEGEIDDGDGDVEPMDIGPPATSTASGHKPSITGLGIGVDEEDNEDGLLEAMYHGLQADSSEESEEE